MKRRTEFKRIAGIRRINSSANGNPAYRITFTDGTETRTSSDASCAYAIGNPGMREDCLVVVGFTRAGRIYTMTAVEDLGKGMNAEDSARAREDLARMNAGVPNIISTALDHFSDYLDDHGERDYDEESLTAVHAELTAAYKWLQGEN